MGLIERFAEKVAEQISKSPALPTGAVTSDLTTQASNLVQNQQLQVGGIEVPLQRNPIFPGVPFNPGSPLIPSAINPVQERGRPDPRRYEYQVAQNINVTATRPVPFTTLRAAADQVDINRRCIEVVKNKIVGASWDIVLSEDASERIAADSGKDHVRAMAEARSKYTDEIARVRSFWEMPDRANGLTYADWMNLSLEEILVLDAWAIWPQMSVGGDLYGLQVLDGSTIKPLIDDRGFRPMPPFPAYQQILWGFPRTEFMAANEEEDADGEFTSDELIYLVKNRRTWSLYGFGPVERALPVADLYLKRQQWLRAEYTDGVLPEIMFTTDADFGNNPELLKAYENVFNDDLAGQTQQRVRARILPAGMEPHQYEGYGERFKDALDNYLITSICGHFGVLPSEIGFNGSGSLGASGLQKGESQSAEVIGIQPMADWISKQISNLCYIYLGMPRELEFKIMYDSKVDTEAEARKTDMELRNGGRTVNEARSAMGLPLLDTPQADMPMVHTGGNVFFLSADGIIDAVSAATAPALEGVDATPVEDNLEIGQKPQQETDNPNQKDPDAAEADATNKSHKEVKAFLKWLRKGNFNRSFEFHEVEEEYALILNKYVEIQDLDSARWYAERYIGL